MTCHACGHHIDEHKHDGCINLECLCDAVSEALNLHLPGCPRSDSATVKRATLWDGVLDTYQTETDLNGFKPKQGALL